MHCPGHVCQTVVVLRHLGRSLLRLVYVLSGFWRGSLKIVPGVARSKIEARFSESDCKENLNDSRFLLKSESNEDIAPN